MKVFAVLTAAAISTVSYAQAPAELTNQQAGIVYDQCLARAAVRASRTDAPDDGIYGLAKRDCAATRASLLVGHDKDAERLQMLAAIDADKEANFPALTKQVRERRKAFEAQTGSPQ